MSYAAESWNATTLVLCTELCGFGSTCVLLFFSFSFRCIPFLTSGKGAVSAEQHHTSSVGYSVLCI